MRILFVTANPLDARLGAPKVLIELAEALRERGCDCDLLGTGELGLPNVPATGPYRLPFCEALARHLKQVAGEYDVIDFDHEFLPYPRDRFSAGTLLVARSILLNHHLRRIHPPSRRTVRSLAGRVVHGTARRRELVERIASADKTMEAADLVNVANDRDRGELIACGVPAEKVVVVPYGLSAARLAAFASTTAAAPPSGNPVIAFVGTFDDRKGAADFPTIAATVLGGVPAASFLLIGTAGMTPDAAGVLAYFPRRIRDRIRVLARFEPSELPQLLASCSAGVFPSYLESFGFGVLEMLAAHLPVIAYDSPGPSSFTPADWLVAPGHAAEAGSRLADVLALTDESFAAQRRRARAIADNMTWECAARQTLSIYELALRKLRAGVGAAARGKA